MRITDKINPLNVHGLRELSFCPPHFVTVEVSRQSADIKEIRDWMHERLTGRFCVVRKHQSIVVGFEIHSESIYFAFMANTIGVKKVFG